MAGTFANMHDTRNEGRFMSITISIATEVTDELVQAFAQLVPQLSSANPLPTRERLQTIISAEACTIFIAWVNGSIVGSLTLAVFSIPTATQAWVEDVVVAEPARRRGVGEALNAAAISEARRRGAITVELTSHPSRAAANRLYQRMGFVARETNVYRLSIEQVDP